jgi:hypothetical protein
MKQAHSMVGGGTLNFLQNVDGLAVCQCNAQPAGLLLLLLNMAMLGALRMHLEN